MKTKFLFCTAALTGIATLLPHASLADPLTDSAIYADITTIPDNDLNGVAETHAFNTAITSITSVQVTLDISGGFNGDYYAYLAHGSTGFAILLNRVGVTASNPSGYPDSGMNVTFSDTAANGDIHNYQSVINPNGASLTGIWQPDGRNVNPTLVTDLSPRTALLSSFDGLDASGNWTLFVADASPLGVGTLEGWSLKVSGTESGSAVPDGANALLELVSIAFGLMGFQHFRGQTSDNRRAKIE